VLTALVLSPLPGRLLEVEDPPERADAALVMAGDPGNERTSAAAELVRDGTARLLVLTGGVPEPGDSAESLRAVALQLGVQPERIRLEHTSVSTRESMVNVEPILRHESVRTLILVTSPSHQRRAFLAARHALPGVRIINRPTHAEPWPPGVWWARRRTPAMLLSEYLKLAYYGVRGWL
jgi:uncharacterized SAM-binding protein YcdF (DUF218 family)